MVVKLPTRRRPRYSVRGLLACATGLVRIHLDLSNDSNYVHKELNHAPNEPQSIPSDSKHKGDDWECHTSINFILISAQPSSTKAKKASSGGRSGRRFSLHEHKPVHGTLLRTLTTELGQRGFGGAPVVVQPVLLARVDVSAKAGHPDD